MSVFSSVYTVKSQLLSNFTTQLATSGLDGGPIQVSWGTPRVLQREAVVLGEVRTPPDQRWHQLGNLKRDETYDLAVYIQAGDPRFDTQQEQTERVYVIADVLATWLLTKTGATPGINLGGVPSGYQSLTGQIAVPDLDEWYDDGFVALLSSAVRVKARF